MLAFRKPNIVAYATERSSITSNQLKFKIGNTEVFCLSNELCYKEIFKDHKMYL